MCVKIVNDEVGFRYFLENKLYTTQFKFNFQCSILLQNSVGTKIVLEMDEI